MSSVSPRAARARPAAWLSAGLAALTLSACATVPNLGPKPQTKAADAYAAARSFKAPQTDWPSRPLVGRLQRPAALRLIDEALKGSPTLAQAEARLRAADAQAEQARGRHPAIGGRPRPACQKTEQSRDRAAFRPSSSSCCPRAIHDAGQVTLERVLRPRPVRQEPRGPGRRRLRREAAPRADVAQARLTLSTAVAQAYGDLVRVCTPSVTPRSRR